MRLPCLNRRFRSGIDWRRLRSDQVELSFREFLSGTFLSGIFSIGAFFYQGFFLIMVFFYQGFSIRDFSFFASPHER